MARTGRALLRRAPGSTAKTTLGMAQYVQHRRLGGAAAWVARERRGRARMSKTGGFFMPVCQKRRRLWRACHYAAGHELAAWVAE